MKIEVWSDFVCPFCYIGKRRLEQALQKSPHINDVELEYKSFELDPNAEEYNGKSMAELIAAKYGMSIEQANENNERLRQQAESVGLTYHFDTMKPTNTFKAHRLAKFAKKHGKEKEITEKLLYGYFTESKNLSDDDVLADIAENTGLDREESLTIIKDDNAYADDVRMDERIAHQYGISGVPFFILNQKYAISGAQPLETFISALGKVWEEENPKPQFEDLSGEGTNNAFCADGSCAIPTDDK